MFNVAALYVRADGPYPGLCVDWYDAERDARTYAGPWPVVVHPPCGPWGRFKWSCKHQDPSLGPIAVEQVQTFGGVLEHPAHSTLFKHCNLPAPGNLPDKHGGITIELEQSRFGHRAPKLTWLYCVGVSFDDAPPLPPVVHNATGRIERMARPERERTPVQFAAWLCQLSQTQRKRRGPS